MSLLFLLALGTGVGLVDSPSVGMAVSGRIKDGECLCQRVDTWYEWNSTCVCGIRNVPGRSCIDDGRLTCFEFECLDLFHECGDEAGIVGGSIGNVIECHCDGGTVNTCVGNVICCTKRKWIHLEETIPFDVCRAEVGLPCHPRFGCWC